jgi:hypothetical protein
MATVCTVNKSTARRGAGGVAGTRAKTATVVSVAPDRGSGPRYERSPENPGRGARRRSERIPSVGSRSPNAESACAAHDRSEAVPGHGHDSSMSSTAARPCGASEPPSPAARAADVYARAATFERRLTRRRGPRPAAVAASTGARIPPAAGAARDSLSADRCEIAALAEADRARDAGTAAWTTLRSAIIPRSEFPISVRMAFCHPTGSATRPGVNACSGKD